MPSPYEEFGCPPGSTRFAWPDSPYEEFIVVDYYPGGGVFPAGFTPHLVKREGQQKFLGVAGSCSDRDPFPQRTDAEEAARQAWGSLPIYFYEKENWPPEC